MSWLASIAVALVSAGAGCWVGSFVTTHYARWHRHSGMEGQTGYAVFVMGALGAAVGFAIGLILSRFIPQSATHAFLKGLGLSLGAVALVGAAAAGIGRATADVPPEIDGRELVLRIELRLPPESLARIAHHPAAPASPVHTISRPGSAPQPDQGCVLVSGTRSGAP